jgi:hypothetical protein
LAQTGALVDMAPSISHQICERVCGGDGSRIFGGRVPSSVNISRNAPGRKRLRQSLQVERIKQTTKNEQTNSRATKQINRARVDLIFRLLPI